MLYVFSSWLARTSEEATIIVLMSDLSFIQNTFEVDKMEHVSEVSHIMYRVAFMFSLVDF